MRINKVTCEKHLAQSLAHHEALGYEGVTSVLLFPVLTRSFLPAFIPAASALHLNLLFFLVSDHCPGQGIVENRSVIRESDSLQEETSCTPWKAGEGDTPEEPSLLWGALSQR